MNEVFIDIRKENKWIQKYFDADFVSIDKLLNVIEDLDAKVDKLQEKLEEVAEDGEPDAYDKWFERNFLGD